MKLRSIYQKHLFQFKTQIKVLIISLLSMFCTDITLYGQNYQQDSTYVPSLLSENIYGKWLSTNNYPPVDNIAHCIISYYGDMKVNGISPNELLGTMGESLGGWFELSHPQEVKIIGDNCIYMVWSNLNLQKIEENTSNETSSYSGTDIPSLLGEFAGNLAASLVTELLTPTKTYHIYEFMLTLVNEYEMIANVKHHSISQHGSDKPTSVTNEEEFLLTKKTVFNGLLLLDRKAKPDINFRFYVEEKYPESVKDYEKSESYAKCKQLFKGINKSKGVKTFNYLQVKKLAYQNEQKILEKGLPTVEKYHPRRFAYLGCKFKEGPQPKTIRIEDVLDWSPAYLYGLKKDDIVMSVDGFSISTAEQLYDYQLSVPPFTTITYHIRRGRKELDVSVELCDEAFPESQYLIKSNN